MLCAGCCDATCIAAEREMQNVKLQIIKGPQLVMTQYRLKEEVSNSSVALKSATI